MVSSTILQSYEAIPPTASSPTVVLVAATSSAEIDLSAFEGKRIHVTCDAAFHVRFGETGMAASDATDWRIPADLIMEYAISSDSNVMRAFSTPGGNLFYTVAST